MTGEFIQHAKLAVKTGIAAIVSLILARMVRLPESYWAPISAIIVTYSDVSAALKASRNRLIGTALGVSIGAAFAGEFGQHLWSFGIAVMITMLLCAVLGLADASRLAGVGVAIVMLVGHAGSPWVVALHRFCEVSIGIVVAVAISALDLPARARPGNFSNVS
jgi:uncharacterized membrane protein YgaE (UPF0421/DUF939 family)